MKQISISEYNEFSKKTDRFSDDEIIPIILGLYGEIGGVMSAVKKLKREDKAFTGFRKSVIEELGDAFWYFCALVRRYGLDVEEIFSKAMSEIPTIEKYVASANFLHPIEKVQSPLFATEASDQALIELGKATAKLFDCDLSQKDKSTNDFAAFSSCYLAVIKSSEISFLEVLDCNIKKTKSRFGHLDIKQLPDFDSNFPEFEQLPRKFEIEIFEKANKKVYMRCNGVFIGSPLTDNIKEQDWFRYHDVIHFSHAAILHWSPTIRALMKHKRKSDPVIDESQDSGRGIVIEEGLAAWVFSKAKELEYFKGHDSVSMDILKTIEDFVRGYEVEACPSKLWERAILQGYDVFRQVVDNKGGMIIGDRELRTLTYKALDKKE